MRLDFVFRSGKFKGKTYEWVSRNASWYINWVLENRPEMLRDHTPSKPKSNNKSNVQNSPSYNDIQDTEDNCGEFKPITPNLDFDKEGPYRIE